MPRQNHRWVLQRNPKIKKTYKPIQLKEESDESEPESAAQSTCHTTTRSSLATFYAQSLENTSASANDLKNHRHTRPIGRVARQLRGTWLLCAAASHVKVGGRLPLAGTHVGEGGGVVLLEQTRRVSDAGRALSQRTSRLSQRQQEGAAGAAHAHRNRLSTRPEAQLVGGVQPGSARTVPNKQRTASHKEKRRCS